MKTLNITAIILLIIAIVISVILGISNKNLGGGSAINVNYYKTATNTSVVCSGATSTLVLAAATRQDSRTSFGITVASSTNITLCKSASGCTVGNGWTLNASGGSLQQVWDDAYYGAYSCIGNGVSSTIGIIYSQS